MDKFFPKIKLGVVNDHFNLLGGGTVHSFKFVEFLKEFYDIDMFVPRNPKDANWMKNFLNIDIDGVSIMQYSKGCGMKYDYMFLNISHWKAEETRALKKFMLVFFPQFYFPVYDYKFLANSEYTKQNIITRWKAKPNDISVVYPPIATNEFKPLEKENIILHVSRITKPVIESDKGHIQIIESFKEMFNSGLKDWKLYLVGQVQDRQYYEKLVGLCHGYPIEFKEGVSFETLKELYGKAKIYWHLTGITMPDQAGAQEHFGMTTVEAMSAGCVPVVLATGGQPEIVVNEDSGFLIKDTDELKIRTLQLIKDEKLMKVMSKSAIERSKYFDEKNIKQSLFDAMCKTNKVSIIMVCWNNLKYTQECIEQLFKVTPPGFELIIVDNASTDGTGAFIEEIAITHKNVKFIHNVTNLGFAEGNNAGLKIASNEYICYLNNDTIPQYGWLEKLIDVMELNKKAGVVGARLYFPKDSGGQFKIQHAGVHMVNGEPEHIGRFQTDANMRLYGVQEVFAVTGACMLVRKELALFNEQYKRGYYEDIDMCLNARKNGYKVYINHEARLIHHEGKSNDILKRNDNSNFVKVNEKNRNIFHKIWDTEIDKLPEISTSLDSVGTAFEETLEIGGGYNPIHKDWPQLDLIKSPNIKYNNDARLLPFANNSLSEICASYVLNCFNPRNAEVALKEWHRCLKSEGKLEIHVPDLEKILRSYLATRDENLLKYIYGDSENELNKFNWSYSFQSLERILSKLNYVRTSLSEAKINKEVSLCVVTYKY